MIRSPLVPALTAITVAVLAAACTATKKPPAPLPAPPTVLDPGAASIRGTDSVPADPTAIPAPRPRPVRPGDDEYRRILTPEQYRITREKGTERAYSGAWWNHHEPGTYRCVCCGATLFSSEHKFDSRTGWPSYWQTANGGNVATERDLHAGMDRTEVHCSRCAAHLGHVFDDGPQPTGLRYCINSAALKFCSRNRFQIKAGREEGSWQVALTDMPFAVCRLSIVPLRREPDFISELMTQVRMGEGVEVLDERGVHWKARLLMDGYEGWVDCRHFTIPRDHEPVPAEYITDDLSVEAVCGEWRIVLPLGTPLPEYGNGAFRIGDETWRCAATVRRIPAGPPDKAALMAYARRYLHTVYLWAGRSVFGIDCSGFTQSVFRAFGVPLNRDTTDQVLQGEPVANMADAVPGDLLFFASSRDEARHVGLLLPCREVMHASATVRIDDMTDEGIRARDGGEITHRLNFIRRFM